MEAEYATRRLRPTLQCRSSAIKCSVPNILVRDIPEDIHAALRRRAEQRGQSLQQYLTAELKRLASRPTLQDVLDRIERRHGGDVGLRQAAEDIAEERSRR